LKNIMGLWLVQECRRRWRQQGREFSYRELTQMAGAAKPFAGYVDPDYPDFLSPGDMPDKINKYLTKTNQPATQDQAEIIRIILESLAWKYRRVLDSLEDIIGAEIDVIHIVGGGIQNELLCQFAADATGKKVITGPVEATAAGNIMMQAIACGQIKSLAQGRKLIRNSFDLKEYKPQNTQAWDEQYLKISKK
jgi:rhamnulokinase